VLAAGTAFKVAGDGHGSQTLVKGGIAHGAGAARCSTVSVSLGPSRRRYKFESPQAWNSDDPRSETGEERRDLTASVLVDPVQPHERIQDQQTGREIGDGLFETAAVRGKIEPHRGANSCSESHGFLRPT
jgi:hypothetical protein